LVHPEDKSPPPPLGVVYDIACESCGEHYIGETARALEKKLGERDKQSKSAIWEHQSKANHEIDWVGVRDCGQKKENQGGHLHQTPASNPK